ncbi:uncharacterized protein [Argopecten irradians]|uniref:uncharacterized protein isoform X2 n=1 Tax=Argopecten irradians TaxID=31199 RepID=UPI003720B26A
MKMSFKLSEEQISGCRRGSDIDIEAIFGGHISGKRTTDVRVNPIFDNEKLNKINVDTDGESDITIISNIETSYTESIDSAMVSNHKMFPENESSPSSERESLKVTNGIMLVGDVVLENGHKNPGFVEDVPDYEEDNLQFSHDKTINGDIISDWPDLDNIALTEAEVTGSDLCNHDNSGESSLPIRDDMNGDINHNTFEKEYVFNKGDPNFNTDPQECNFSPSEKIKTDSCSHNDSKVHEISSCVTRGSDDSSGCTQDNTSQLQSDQKESKNSQDIQNCESVECPKLIKPILVTGISVDETEGTGEHCEHKSVKFSDDTVFNDGRPNKYRRDTKLITLREIHKGKFNSDFSLAKPNFMFLDVTGKGLTDDEKLAQSKLAQNEAGDIESIGVEEKQHYDELIKRTIAAQRRSRLIRLIFAFLVFLVVIAIVVLLVIYFGKS